MFTTLRHTRPLIIDDRGPKPLTAEQRRDPLGIVGDRYEKASLLVTSQIPVRDRNGTCASKASTMPCRWCNVQGDATEARRRHSDAFEARGCEHAPASMFYPPWARKTTVPLSFFERKFVATLKDRT